MRFRTSSCRSKPNGMSKRANEIGTPLPSGATTVRLNLSSIASVAGVSAPNRSQAVPGGQPRRVVVGRVDQMAVRVGMALDLHGGAGVEPVGEHLGDAEAELVEAEIEVARCRLGLGAAGELGNDLDVRVVVGGGDEEAPESEPAYLGLRQADEIQRVLAEADLLLARRRRRCLGRDQPGGCRRGRRRRCDRGRSGGGRDRRCRGDRTVTAAGRPVARGRPVSCAAAGATRGWPACSSRFSRSLSRRISSFNACASVPLTPWARAALGTSATARAHERAAT